MVSISICNFKVAALLDTGCSNSIISKKFVEILLSNNGCVVAASADDSKIRMLNSNMITACGTVTLNFKIEHQSLTITFLVVADLLCDLDVILGMDVVNSFDRVIIENGRIQCYRPTNADVSSGGGGISVQRNSDEKEHCNDISVDSTAGEIITIVDDDFTAVFDKESARWSVRWKWIDSPPKLSTNQPSHYKIPSECIEDFEQEVDQWISDGIMQLYEGNMKDVKAIIPLFSVFQHSKNKVRPVLDYRHLNDYLSCHSGDAVACTEKLRRWRRFGNNLALVDLRRAYLQIHVEPDLQLYQAVRYKGQVYLMTRMAFGLSVAPKIMTAIVSKILGMDDVISQGTDSYIDDIVVDEDVVDAQKVRNVLLHHGLVTKDIERVTTDGMRVLGLRLYWKNDELRWKRDDALPVIENCSLTRRQLFSLCGKLVGHYPVAGWLRVACNYIKRQTGQQPWDDAVDGRVLELMNDVLRRVKIHDPVGGKWTVSDTKVGEVWADASSVAIGACVKINGEIVEDATWLRPKDNAMHINVAELESLLKGINMALRWDLKEITLVTDSTTCYGWLCSAIYKSKTIRTKGMAEMLVRRRLLLLEELIREYQLVVTVRVVRSQKNIADVLTRVDSRWLKPVHVTAVADFSSEIRESHERHHFGVNKTLELLDEKVPATRTVVAEVVKSCEPCTTIDPAVHDRWQTGNLVVEKIWYRLAVDITHYSGKPYLTIIDCCSRYAVWKLLRNECVESVVFALEDVFASIGSPAEILTDNGGVFTSDGMKQLLLDWNVGHILSGAYRPEGNGLVERNHRTIKRSACRGNQSIAKVVSFYNSTRHVSICAVPYELLFVARNRLSGTRESRQSLDSRPAFKKCNIRSVSGKIRDNPFQVGDLVYVKPANARCTTRWLGPIRVSRVINSVKVALDGTVGQRHISHLRRFRATGVDAELESAEDADVLQDISSVAESISDSDSSGIDERPVLRRSTRERRPVERLTYDTF